MSKIRPHRVLAWNAFLLITVAYATMAMVHPAAYIIATYEDFVGEWAQVFFFVIAFAFSLRLAIAQSRYRFFFLILALACFYVFMEEISWGQRIFKIETPAFFQRHNLQQETNLHNLLTGPYSTALKHAIEAGLAIGLAGFGLAYPLFWLYGSRLAEWLERKGIPPPPLYLWPFFTAAAFLELEPFGFNEAEIAEILVSSGLAIFTMHYWVCHRLLLMDQCEPCADIQVSRRIALNMGLIVIGTFLLAGIATSAAYCTPRYRAAMDDRFNAGLEKFARRYQNHGRMDRTIGLYLLLNDRDPGKASILRKVAHAYKAADDTANYEHYAYQALQLDLAELTADPGSISAHLSLAQTYKLLQEYEKSLDHLNDALDEARSQAQQQPDSANAAYWLGKAYEQKGAYSDALTYYRRAIALEPAANFLEAYRRLAQKPDKETVD